MASVTLDTTKLGVLSINGKKYKPQRFQVQGKTLELYSIAALAHALNRTGSTIIEWETYGLLPPPRYRITGKGDTVERRRFYSREQIINLFQVSNRFPFGRGMQARYRNHFFTAINQIFDAEEILNVAEITIRPKAVPALGSFSYTPSGQPKPKQFLPPQPESHRGVDSPIQHRSHTAMASPERIDRTPQARRQEPQHDFKHPTGVDQNAHSKKPNYRRRPSAAIS